MTPVAARIAWGVLLNAAAPPGLRRLLLPDNHWQRFRAGTKAGGEGDHRRDLVTQLSLLSQQLSRHQGPLELTPAKASVAVPKLLPLDAAGRQPGTAQGGARPNGGRLFPPGLLPRSS